MWQDPCSDGYAPGRDRNWLGIEEIQAAAGTGWCKAETWCNPCCLYGGISPNLKQNSISARSSSYIKIIQNSRWYSCQFTFQWLEGFGFVGALSNKFEAAKARGAVSGQDPNVLGRARVVGISAFEQVACWTVTPLYIPWLNPQGARLRRSKGGNLLETVRLWGLLRMPRSTYWSR